MTNEELLKSRLTTIAQIMKEWSDEAYKSADTYKEKHPELSEWHTGKAAAYKLAADWILETIHKGE